MVPPKAAVFNHKSAAPPNEKSIGLVPWVSRENPRPLGEEL
jgi:hypothetical protein